MLCNKGNTRVAPEPKEVSGINGEHEHGVSGGTSQHMEIIRKVERDQENRTHK